MSDSEPVYIIVDSVVLQGQEADLVSGNAVPKSYVDSHITAAVDALVASAPGTLDTLKEIANALGNDANLASVLTSQINSVQTALTAEAATRAGADASLDGKIDAEALVRAGDINNLTQNLNIEVDNRSSANAGLSGRIDVVSASLENEQGDRSSADAGLSGRIDVVSASLENEQGDRSSADSSLSGRIDVVSASLENEQGDRSSADAGLSARIDAEVKRAEDVEALKFDKSGGTVSGDLTLDSYLNFGANWRARGSADGSRLVFEYKRAGVWRVGVPFIARTQ